jgi:hypothetical protein
MLPSWVCCSATSSLVSIRQTCTIPDIDPVAKYFPLGENATEQHPEGQLIDPLTSSFAGTIRKVPGSQLWIIGLGCSNSVMDGALRQNENFWCHPGFTLVIAFSEGANGTLPSLLSQFQGLLPRVSRVDVFEDEVGTKTAGLADSCGSGGVWAFLYSL